MSREFFDGMGDFDRSISEQSEDPFQTLPARPLRQYTDSVLTSTGMRNQLENTIAELLRSHLPSTTASSTELHTPGWERRLSEATSNPSAPSEPPASGLVPATALEPRRVPEMDDPFATLPENPWRQCTDPTQLISTAMQRRIMKESDLESLPLKVEGVSSVAGLLFENVPSRVIRSDQPSEVDSSWTASPTHVRPTAQAGIVGSDSPMFSDQTTVMIRHIPPKLTQRQLLKEVNDLGLAGRFDFLYIPMDSRRRSNRGIAFINFVTPAVATEYASAQHKQTLRHPSSQRPLEIMPADLQGFEANVAHHTDALQNQADANRPLILKKGSHLGPRRQEFGSGGKDLGKGGRAQQQGQASANTDMGYPSQPQHMQQRPVEGQANLQQQQQPQQQRRLPQQQQQQLQLQQPQEQQVQQHFRALQQQIDQKLLLPQQQQYQEMPFYSDDTIGEHHGGADALVSGGGGGGGQLLAGFAGIAAAPSPDAGGSCGKELQVRFCAFCGTRRGGAAFMFCPSCGNRYLGS